MAEKVEGVGVKKAVAPTAQTFVLAILAGAFIALGAVFATTVTTGCEGLPYGLVRLLGGVSFSLGLILVVVAGAELFTGNNLIVVAWASGKISTRQVLRNWYLVYLGNFLGSVLTAALMFLAGQYQFAQGRVGVTVLNIATAKLNYGFTQAVVLGVFCNALVCLAVWLCLSARTTTDKVLAIIFPISAFVAAGFEHSVANMYFVPIGLFVKSGASPSFWLETGLVAADYAGLTWLDFLTRNLLPVTIGNIVGGSFFVGAVYWFVYRRRDAVS